MSEQKKAKNLLEVEWPCKWCVCGFVHQTNMNPIHGQNPCSSDHFQGLQSKWFQSYYLQGIFTDQVSITLISEGPVQVRFSSLSFCATSHTLHCSASRHYYCWPFAQSNRDQIWHRIIFISSESWTLVMPFTDMTVVGQHPEVVKKNGSIS